MTIKFLKRNSDDTVSRSTMEPFKFPAGEWHLKNIDPDEVSAGAMLLGTDVDDLVLLGLWADAVRASGQRTVAYIPYAPAARADRGTPFGARIYAGIINSFNLDEVVVFDPHSPVIVEELNNVRVVESAPLIGNFFGDNHDFTGVIAPDKGALERASDAAEVLQVPVYTATKERDFETGKLKNFAIEGLPSEGHYLIVDDICDGGGTFAGLAAASGLSKDQLSLWVSHGVFSGRAGDNLQAFRRVYTTNSYPNARNEDVNAIIVNVETWLLFHTN